MTKAAETLKTQLATLPPKDREELVYFLWDTLEGESLPDLSDEWTEELERRAKELDDNPAMGIDGEQVFEELRKKYS